MFVNHLFMTQTYDGILLFCCFEVWHQTLNEGLLGKPLRNVRLKVEPQLQNVGSLMKSASLQCAVNIGAFRLWPIR